MGLEQHDARVSTAQPRDLVADGAVIGIEIDVRAAVRFPSASGARLSR